MNPNHNQAAENKIEKVVFEILDLLIAKNRDYGDSWQTAGPIANDIDTIARLRVRIDDKLARISNLLKPGAGKPAVNNESLRDTVMDIAGYCVLWAVAIDENHDDSSGNVNDGFFSECGVANFSFAKFITEKTDEKTATTIINSCCTANDIVALKLALSHESRPAVFKRISDRIEELESELSQPSQE